MNRAEAAAILSVDPEASADEARRAYQDLFTEHQVRLTNAPTPALRSLYQARLLELDEARDVLLAPSIGDADSDLPTDQPSIPSHISKDAPAPPPRASAPPPTTPRPEVKRSADAAPPRAEAPREPAAPKKKPGRLRKIVTISVVLTVVVFSAFQILSLIGNSRDTQRGAEQIAADVDSLPPIREAITVARVEFGRGDYDAANKALSEADQRYASIASLVAWDTAATNIKAQLDSLHAKVTRACDALKKVAERHPGEPTCKTF